MSYKKNSFIYGVNLASYANIDLTQTYTNLVSRTVIIVVCLLFVYLFIIYIFNFVWLEVFFFQSIVFFQGFLFKAVFFKAPKKEEKKTYYNKFKQPVTQIFIIVKILVRIHLNYLRKLTQT